MGSDENSLGKQTQRGVLHTTDNQTGQAQRAMSPRCQCHPMTKRQ